MPPWIPTAGLLIAAALAVRVPETTFSPPAPFELSAIAAHEIAASVVPNTTPLAVGTASFYASRFHGRRTASGTVYDETQSTAAHQTLPFGTVLKVTNLVNLRSVIVRVTDRGPYTGGRILDLSLSAAREIGMVERGVVKVSVEKVEG